VSTDPVAGAGIKVGVDPTGATPVQGGDPQKAQVKKLAQEFEAMLMTQMLREMRRSMLSEDTEEEGGGGLGRDTMTDTIDVELGSALSRVGGFGLTSVLLKAIERGAGIGGTSPAVPGLPSTGPVAPLSFEPASVAPVSISGPGAVVAPAQAPARSPAQAPAPDASLPAAPGTGTDSLKLPEGHVTSAYGWRRDPFTGEPRFHKGIDVAQAYGHDVPAAGAGRVVFAGDRGTYGTMVVVEHPSGQQTLYAHLLAAGVKTGDEIGAGQVIGKSGDSGRSTGPHLHFEVVEAGRAVDPAHH